MWGKNDVSAIAIIVRKERYLIAKYRAVRVSLACQTTLVEMLNYKAWDPEVAALLILVSVSILNLISWLAQRHKVNNPLCGPGLGAEDRGLTPHACMMHPLTHGLLDSGRSCCSRMCFEMTWCAASLN